MIFQDPYASLNPRWKVADIVAEPLREHGLVGDGEGAADAQARIVGRRGSSSCCSRSGSPAADVEKFPHQFSGGQRQRISIARALATEPEFLVCDEPTSALDVSVQAQVLNIMKDLQRARGLTYLFISHNLAVVRHVSDEVGVMYLGRLVELRRQGASCSRAPRHPYTRMLLDAIPDIHMSGRARTPVQGEVPNPLNPPTGCTFHPRCPHANERCTSERPALLGTRWLRRRLPRGRGRADLKRRAACHVAVPGSTRQAVSGSRCSPRNRSSSVSRSRISQALVARHQHLGGAAAGVVVARHAHAVGAGRQHGDEVAGCDRERRGRGRASRRIRRPGRRRRTADGCASRSRRQATMSHPGAVHRRAHQVVHRRVDDAEVLARRPASGRALR